MCPTQNTQQYFISFISLCINGFKMLMATMLSISIKLKCNILNNISNNISDAYGKCMFVYDINHFNQIPIYNLIIMLFNIFSLIIMIGFYIFEYYRERWCIQHLEINKNLIESNLSKEIEAYHNIKKQMDKLNRQYFTLSVFVVCINLINIGLTSILVYKYYIGYETLMSAFMAIILILDKLIKCIMISYSAYENRLMYSAFMTSITVYNTIDPKYKKSN